MIIVVGWFFPICSIDGEASMFVDFMHNFLGHSTWYRYNFFDITGGLHLLLTKNQYSSGILPIVILDFYSFPCCLFVCSKQTCLVKCSCSWRSPTALTYNSHPLERISLLCLYVWGQCSPHNARVLTPGPVYLEWLCSSHQCMLWAITMAISDLQFG